jgi:hypothetical protein
MTTIILCALDNLYHCTLTAFDFQIHRVEGEGMNIDTNYLRK